MSALVTENRYYVYAYLDPRKPGSFKYGDFVFDFEPFYMGKGSGHRHTQHICHAKRNYRTKSPRVQKIMKLLSLGFNPIVIKVKDKINEDLAYEIEERLIASIGRLDLGTGALTNCSIGGRECQFQGESLRLKIISGQKIKPDRSGKNNPMYGSSRKGKDSPHYGHRHTEKTKLFFSNLHKGCPPNKTSFKTGHETWNKNKNGLQEAWNKGLSMPCKNYTFIKDGTLVVINDLRRYCKENKLAYSAMIRLYTKGYSHDKKKDHYTAKNYYKGYSNINYEVGKKF